MKPVAIFPTLITLANAFVGVLALSKAIDALAWEGQGPGVFHEKMEFACMLVFVGMVFDMLDGWVARATRAFSAFGAQLDSFADALTFGLVPAMLAKVLIEHEGDLVTPRIGFLGAAAFALMAILRLVRYNLESDADKAEEDPEAAHPVFRGLPSPAAAGAIASTIWLYLVLRRPELETSEGLPTPFSRVMGWMEVVEWGPVLDVVPIVLACMLPALGLLMVSRVRYLHAASTLLRQRSNFFTLVAVLFAIFLFYLAPVPVLFLLFNGYVLVGVALPLLRGARHAGQVAAARGRAQSG